MTTSIRIRPATLDDALAIATIHVASWQHAYRGIMPDAFLHGLSPDDRLPNWTRILASPQQGVYVGVAEKEGTVVGFYSIAPPNEDDVPSDAQMLYTIYLHPDAMGQGTGRALIIDAERQMIERGATSGVLRVVTANAGTRAFYERCGWTPDPLSARIEDAWGQPVETIRYTKRSMTP